MRRIDWGRLTGLVTIICMIAWIAPKDAPIWKVPLACFVAGLCYPSVFPRRT